MIVLVVIAPASAIGARARQVYWTVKDPSILGINNMILKAMLGHCLREGVAKNIFELLIRIGDFVYSNCEYLWAGLQCNMSSTHKGNKSRFVGLGGIQKRAQRNFFDPRLSLVSPNIMAPLNGQFTPLDSWESQEEFTAVYIYGYEVFSCFAFTTVTVGHAKCQLMYSIHSKLVAFSACHEDMNIF